MPTPAPTGSRSTSLVDLSGPVNLTIDKARGIGTILNNDPEPRITISDFSLGEGGLDGPRRAPFHVDLSAPSAKPITVAYATADDSGVVNVDYQPLAGTLTFAPGETRKTLEVFVLGNTTAQPDRTFRVQLSGPTNAVLEKAVGVGTIVDDDLPDQPNGPTAAGRFDWTSSFYSAFESDGSTTITVRRTGGSAGTVRIPYSISDLSARSGTDYVADPPSGVLTFVQGETSKTLTIALINNEAIEDAKAVHLALGTPDNGGRLGANTSATLSILDDDGLAKPPPPPPPPPLVRVVSGVMTTKKGKISGLVLRFSDGLNGATASFVGNYTLRAAGKDKKYGTKDDKKYRLLTASYDGQARTVTLAPAKVTKGTVMQLVVNGTSPSGVSDMTGRLIDGNRDTKAGGDAWIVVNKKGVVVS